MEHAALNADVAQKVGDIIASATGVPPAEISLSMRLREDLGVDGDDVDDLLLALQDGERPANPILPARALGIMFADDAWRIERKTRMTEGSGEPG